MLALNLKQVIVSHVICSRIMQIHVKAVKRNIWVCSCVLNSHIEHLVVMQQVRKLPVIRVRSVCLTKDRFLNHFSLVPFSTVHYYNTCFKIVPISVVYFLFNKVSNQNFLCISWFLHAQYVYVIQFVSKCGYCWRILSVQDWRYLFLYVSSMTMLDNSSSMFLLWPC
jgi:hypothetical protein